MVAQLVDRSLPTPEVHGSNIIGETIEQFATNCNSEKTHEGKSGRFFNGKTS